MVLPLIPVVIIAVGALTGSGGLALGGKGALDIKNATDRMTRDRRRYDLRFAHCERKIADTNELLVGWGREQEKAIETVVIPFADFLRKNAKQVRESEKLLADGLDVSSEPVVGLDGLRTHPWEWVGGVAAAAALGGGANVAAIAAVTSFGAASTGAAISGLSGAAAQSATMAWLGGGALSAGGGGVALGATALNFVTLGPALLVGGLVVGGQGKKAKTQALKKQAEIDIAIAELEATSVLLAAILDRVAELRSILQRLTADAMTALDTLESEPFLPREHARRFQSTFMLVKAVCEVAAAPVLDADGDLSTESTTLTVKYRTMTEDKANA
ncbi:hypothetical protein [Rhodococcus sp. 1168]|uniref:hypothetical protein n=1 Tax=Rhodococcus sp. 1168 TaxID=2018041 RepID=UPI000A0C47FD|nr:hypothetical protein [Rhodococcus sp. 1168]ORI19655.1 hypothetical protein BJI47_07580 [Rhodococcus sp. 1168]